MVSSIKCIPLLLCGPMDMEPSLERGNDPPPIFLKKILLYVCVSILVILFYKITFCLP